MGDEQVQRGIDWCGKNEQIRALAILVIRGPCPARLVQRDVGILEPDAPTGAAQRDPDRSSDEAQTGDERAPRGSHQRAIRMMVRSTTCEVVKSK